MEKIVAANTQALVDKLNSIAIDIKYYVTDKGIMEFKKLFKEQVTDKYKPSTRSQERYRRYMSLDLGISFAEYLGIKKGII